MRAKNAQQMFLIRIGRRYYDDLGGQPDNGVVFVAFNGLGALAIDLTRPLFDVPAVAAGAAVELPLCKRYVVPRDNDMAAGQSSRRRDIHQLDGMAAEVSGRTSVS